MRTFMTILALSGMTSFAVAQTAAFCPEGRTSSGACVNPRLADDARTTAIVLSQQKLSFTGPPVLSDIEGNYAVPRDRREILLNQRPKGY